MEEIRRSCNENVLKVLIGTKADLGSEISFDEGTAIASRYGALYIETSAKTSYKVDLIFQFAASEILSQLRTNKRLSSKNTSRIVLNPQELLDKENACC